MKSFPRDILVTDFEVTDFDIETGEPVQIGLLLLDKDTLLPKWSYDSWIKPTIPVSTQLKGFLWASLDEEDVKRVGSARDLATVAAEILPSLPDSYFLCAWNATFDFCFWNKLLKTVGKKAKTANILDLWTLAQVHLLQDENYVGNYGSESVFQYFGAEPRTKHYGISDCEIEAMVLRKLVAANFPK